MKILVTIDTDEFDYSVVAEGTATTPRDLRQLVALSRAVIGEMQGKIDAAAAGVESANMPAPVEPATPVEAPAATPA